MVVISAGVVTRTKTLFARQYLEVSRLQIESLLSTFSKLVDSHPSSSRPDHTFIETDHVRFVYQPMEAGLFLVLVTTKDSNIIENQETLRLLSKLLQEICHRNPAASSTQSSITNEDAVLANAFDIVFAFDEAISFGHREPVTSAQINQFVEMESHEERLHQMIQQSKENDAKETAKRRQQELTELRKKQLKDEKLAAIAGVDRPVSGGASISAAGPSSLGSSAVSSSSPHIGGFESSMDANADSSIFGTGVDAARRHEDLLARQAAFVAAANHQRASANATSWNPSMNVESVDYSSQPTSAAASAPKKSMALGARKR